MATESISNQPTVPFPKFVRERHLDVDLLAKAWGVHPCTIRRLFRDEPGVLKITKKKRGKRVWVMLRIPESVAERVYRRLTEGGSRG